MKRKAIAGLAAFLALSSPANVWAWGATGHEWISGIAVELLPEELPAFLRTPDTVADIAALGREPDRSRGSGAAHDKERDPGHYIDLDDEGRALGVIALIELPATREAYDTALRKYGFTQYRAGYLPYAIVDGWQQLVKDFAYWRADVQGAKTAADAADRAWFEADRIRRERIIVSDLGNWSHYVADASQPLHVSEHFNGWGPYPNPRGFSTLKSQHEHFESVFVRANLDRASVKDSVRPYQPCQCSIEDQVKSLISTSQAQVVPLYELEQQGAFIGHNEMGIRFATARLALGATALRDMIVDAWAASADMGVGYPMTKVRDIERGQIAPTKKMFGAD